MLEYKELVAPSLKELFVQEMESMILTGRLKVGERLPSERELSKAMNVSRSVVNSGLVDMARKGFLEIRPRSGTYVADYHRNGTIETMISIMQCNGGQFPLHTIYSFAELRSELKKMALGKICKAPRLDEDEVYRIKKKIDALGETALPSRAAELATELDHDVAFLSGNDILPLIFSSWRKCWLPIFTRYFEKEGMIPYYTTLVRRVYDNMRIGNVEECYAAIDEGTQNCIAGNSGIVSL